jgi:hypothetical protein
LDELIDQTLVIGAYKQGSQAREQRLIEPCRTSSLDQLYKREIADQLSQRSRRKLQYENLGSARPSHPARHRGGRRRGESRAGQAPISASSQGRAPPVGREQCGDLSWFAEILVPAFQDVAFSLKPPDLPAGGPNSATHRRARKRRSVDRQPFEQVKAGIEQQVRQHKTQARLREFLTQVRERAELRLDMEMLKLVQETYRDTTGPLEFKSQLDPNALNVKLQIRHCALPRARSSPATVRQANSVRHDRPSFWPHRKGSCSNIYAGAGAGLGSSASIIRRLPD